VRACSIPWACHSAEKLVTEAEAIASAQRLSAGIEARTEKLAVSMFAQVGLHGDFLHLKGTGALFRCEQHFPSAVIDRSICEEGDGGPARDAFGRARARVDDLLASYSIPYLSAEVRQNLLPSALAKANARGWRACRASDRLRAIWRRCSCEEV
jgi:trimethylamine:corrinoid methyltransferase-like protein